MDMDQRYQETLDYIYSFVENSLTHQEDLSLENSDLSNMESLMEKLGKPHTSFPCIHVAGSKGKGSVSAFCATALEYEGYKVGLFTSPHLRDYEERMQINREPISRETLVALVEEMKPLIEDIPGINTFEITTALAFQYFKNEGVDFAVIEVGLGGRLDATNVITPLLSVITALFLEHTYILGDTIEEIAMEKGGIIKPGIPVVVSPQSEAARETITKIAKERGSRLVQVGLDFTFEGADSTLEKQVLIIQTQQKKEQVALEIRLLGAHQLENATAAYAALQVLREQGVDISQRAIQEGFANTSWPARFEILSLNPTVIVDSAHNPDSARKIKQTLDEHFPGRPIIIVFGVSEDKNIQGMIQAFRPGVDLIICSQSTHPRAMDAAVLVGHLTTFDIPVRVIKSIGKALEEAVIMAGEEAVVLVTGSIFVAATGRIAWYENMKNLAGMK
jgi:dihydrofolate synthase/folylpolyglutamate synthase